MDHIRHHHAHWASVGMIWNAAVAIGLLIGLWLPMILAHG